MITCPHCGTEQEATPDKKPDGTRVKVCSACRLAFNYVVRGGKVQQWFPPAVSGMIFRGAGKPGGS